MDRVGTEGRGESVWLGWFFYDTLRKFREVMHIKVDHERIRKFELIAETLRDNLNDKAWDGEWYRRAYFDDGTPLGSIKNEECKIDAIAQSWAIISGGGDPEKSRRGLQNAGKYLVKKEEQIIQLLDPPFDKSALNPGYIKGYVPGVRENGGQYTHAAIWMIMAYAELGERERVWELLEMVLPIHHGRTKEEIMKYKAEPYVIAADVYAIAEHAGRGGWTWYTGSAGWMYQLIIEHVCGLNRKANSLAIEPCLPPHWGEVTIRYKYQTADYVIVVRQSPGDRELKSVIVDDVGVEDGVIHLEDDGREHRVEVTIVFTAALKNNTENGSELASVVNGHEDAGKK
jgi:cellobiose phosphorylase